jgi:hypothetical protein
MDPRFGDVSPEWVFKSPSDTGTGNFPQNRHDLNTLPGSLPGRPGLPCGQAAMTGPSSLLLFLPEPLNCCYMNG